MKFTHDKNGFTFIEVLVVIAILLILVAISVVTFKKISTSSSHRIVTQEVFLALTDSRNDALASENDEVYGVHFATSSITTFAGDTYSASDPNNTKILFTGNVFATSSLISDGVDVVFKKLTGFPTATGTLYIVSGDGQATNTITISDTGLIEN